MVIIQSEIYTRISYRQERSISNPRLRPVFLLDESDVSVSLRFRPESPLDEKNVSVSLRLRTLTNENGVSVGVGDAVEVGDLSVNLRF